MNENLARLKALVAETNEVVANLNKETESIKEGNQEERAIKFALIRDYLMDCWEVAREIGVDIKVKLDGKFERITYTTDVWLVLNVTRSRKQPILFYSEYYSRNLGLSRNEDDGFGADSVWKVDDARQYSLFPCFFGLQNEFDFVDKWNQEAFEKRFAAEVEKAITEKANKANEKYQTAVNSKALLGR